MVHYGGQRRRAPRLRKVCGPVQCGACAAYLSNDDGHTPRAASYPPFPMIRIPVLGAISTRNRGRGVAVE